jgi:uncharacterized protein (TIGR01777 family)
MRIFVTGATGLVGRHLCAALRARGDQVVALTRRPEAARAALAPGAAALGAGLEVVAGDPVERGPWTSALAGCDAVVHLAGENVFERRWSDEQKQRLWRSRVDSTAVLADAWSAAAPGSGPRTFVSASAIGYYGLRRDEPCTEDASPGTDFLARLSVAWEAAAHPAAASARVVLARIGVVLAPDGGALATMRRPFALGLGGPLGDGRQWVSWIHVDDLVRLLLRVLDDDTLRGPVNATAPSPVTNAELSHAVAAALRRPCVARVPRLALRTLFGEVADVMLGGQRVLPQRLLDAGFRFQHPTCPEAVRSALAPSTGKQMAPATP